MGAPTLIAAVQIGSPWSQTANVGAGTATIGYASTITTQAGDLIVGIQGGADGNTTGEISLADGTNSYTQRTTINSPGHTSIDIATATDGAGGTRTLTWNRAATANAIEAGGVVAQFRNHGGVGNVFTAVDGVQTGNLTCSANSAILVICLDWNAVAGSPTWASIDGSPPTATYGVDGDATTWAAAVAYFADVGAAGVKAVTLSTPTFGTPSFAAIEILGPGVPTIDTQPTSQVTYVGQTATFNISATTSGGTLHYQWKDDGGNVGTDSSSYTTAAGTLADSGSLITCDVTDDNGTTTSITVVWTVLPAAISAWWTA